MVRCMITNLSMLLTTLNTYNSSFMIMTKENEEALTRIHKMHDKHVAWPEECGHLQKVCAHPNL